MYLLFWTAVEDTAIKSLNQINLPLNVVIKKEVSMEEVKAFCSQDKPDLILIFNNSEENKIQCNSKGELLAKNLADSFKNFYLDVAIERNSDFDVLKCKVLILQLNSAIENLGEILSQVISDSTGLEKFKKEEIF